jgi:hypothetical protein
MEIDRCQNQFNLAILDARFCHPPPTLKLRRDRRATQFLSSRARTRDPEKNKNHLGPRIREPALRLVRHSQSRRRRKPRQGAEGE